MEKIESIGTRRRNLTLLSGLIAASSLLFACGGNTVPTDDTPAQTSDAEFIKSSHASTAGDNDLVQISQLPSSLTGEYDKYEKYTPQTGWGDDNNNSIGFIPRRFEASFSEGDGSGADTVCEELKVPAGARYVQAVTDSEKLSWIGYQAEDSTAYLCFPSSGNPDTVAVWASNVPQ